MHAAHLFCRLLELAESYGILQEPLTGLSLGQFLAMHCSEAMLTRSIDVDAVTAEVAKLAVIRGVPEGQALFSFGEVPESFFLILKVGRWKWGDEDGADDAASSQQGGRHMCGNLAKQFVTHAQRWLVVCRPHQ